MKNLLFIALALFAFTQSSFAQDEEVVIPDGWHNGGAAAFNFSQASFTNWASGGVDNITGVLTGGLFANYKMGKSTWDNTLNLGYGLTRLAVDTLQLRKTDDIFDLSSKYGYSLSKKWSAATLFNFRTQFTDGFSYIDLRDPVAGYVTETVESPVSKLFSPAYLSLGVGADYKPSENFSLYISPLTARWVIVTDEALSNAGAYGVDPGENILTEVGANIVAGYKRQLTETIFFTTNLGLFHDYLGDVSALHSDGVDTANGGEFGKLLTTDVNWTAGITAQVWKVISVSLKTHYIWDYNTRLSNPNAYNPADGTFALFNDPKGQFKEVLGVGLTYTFNNLK